jgi:hypothetical protein
MPERMRAVVQRAFGGPEVLEVGRTTGKIVLTVLRIDGRVLLTELQ